MVTSVLPDKKIQLHKIVPIRPNLGRAKITDSPFRRDHLNASKTLETQSTPEYSLIDLTFKQRNTVSLPSTTKHTQKLPNHNLTAQTSHQMPRQSQSSSFSIPSPANTTATSTSPTHTYQPVPHVRTPNLTTPTKI